MILRASFAVLSCPIWDCFGVSFHGHQELSSATGRVPINAHPCQCCLSAANCLGQPTTQTAGLLDQKLKSEPEGFNELRTAKACLLSARGFSNHFQSLNRAIWAGILLFVCRSCYSKIFSLRCDGSRKVSMLRRRKAVNSFEGVDELIDAGETD